MDRDGLVEAGQDYAFGERYNAFHLNYKELGWKRVKKPYTPYMPFTPSAVSSS